VSDLLAGTHSQPGADLLEKLDVFLGRFVAYPSQAARVAHVLWIAHTHRMDAWESTPRIAFLSTEPGSGKSRALEVTELLVPRPVHAVSTTPAYLFRKVSDQDGRPTVLYDEIDTIFGPRARDNEDIRGMLNAGHRKGATAGRCVTRGNVITTEDLPAYCAVALAGLDDLPPTLMSRSVVVRMRRRAPNEIIEPFRHRVHATEGNALRDALAAWSEEIEVEGWPEMPVGIADRNADVWEALVAVADLAGGAWPERARRAAVTLVTEVTLTPASLGVQLLTDIQTVFCASTKDHLSTESILNTLNNIEETPWGDLNGKPLDARGLARRLKKYEVRPKTVRDGSATAKGYSRSDFYDAWTRYVTSHGPANSEFKEKRGAENGEMDTGHTSLPPSSVVAVTADTPSQTSGSEDPVRILYSETQVIAALERVFGELVEVS
jgi:hypothetical protein